MINLKPIKTSVRIYFFHSFFLIDDLEFTGKFLYDNYKQALMILETRPAVNEALMKVGAAGGVTVESWLREEETYLRGLSKEPLEETLEMEYYKMLMNMHASE
jgi:hypothetical protein